MVIFLSSVALAESNLSAEGAMKKIFPTIEKYEVENRILDEQTLKIFTVFREEKVIGWAVVLDEMGKINPITFLVGIDKQGTVLGVYVLEYRDMFGSEIKRRSFMRQFQGKTIKDPIKIGRDIDAVTQATISSQAAATAVRKSLRIIEELQK
jgi:Na+-translocating ferredoxin:NAD+ oxidoreductase RnfG subunit